MPAVVEVAEEGDAIVLRLPPRDLKWFVRIGLATQLVAGVFAGVIYAFLAWMPAAPQPVVFNDFLIPIVTAGIGLVFLTIGLLGSGTEVRIVAREVLVTERLGPFRWSFGCPLSSVRRIAVRHFFAARRQENAPPPSPDDLAMLVIECRGHPEVQFAQGYRRRQLLELAGELAARCGTLGEDAPTPVEVVEQDEASLFQELAHQPAGSSVSCDRHPDGVTLVIPPDPAAKIIGQTLLAVVPLLVLIAFRIWQIALLFPVVDPLEVAMLSFGCVALLAVILHARARGRRRSVLAVVGDRLLIAAAGAFRVTRYEWDRADLYDVRSGIAAGRGDEAKRAELQVWARDGKKTALLPGRDEGELRWLATVLRRELRLPPPREEMLAAREEMAAVSSD